MAKSIFTLNRPLSNEDMLTRRRALVRLGLAWLAMMQVMMFALPGYLRQDAYGQDNLDVLDWAIFLMNWASLVLTVPVILYSAWPVWRGAWQACQQRRTTMDIPVTISISAAFIPSVLATWQGHGEVYFDSVTMFVAFLLTARYFETRATQAVNHAQYGEELKALRKSLFSRADCIAKWFVVVQLGIAFVVATYWWVINPTHALAVMVALLVMSCPCALSLSAPVSLAAAHATLAAYPDLTPEETLYLYKKTAVITRQNLYGSLLFHLVTTPLAALGLVTPWVAALAMLVSSVAVCLNAYRLYQKPVYDYNFAPLKTLPSTQRGH
jgi:cation transport ATPase